MEHEDLRESLWELRRLVGESEAPEGVYEQLGETTETLGNLLVEHTHTEHHIFFPMAEALLTDAERTEMAQKFGRIEEEQGGRRSE
jgi:hemerythrin-like domain-containing protein